MSHGRNQNKNADENFGNDEFGKTITKVETRIYLENVIVNLDTWLITWYYH